MSDAYTHLYTPTGSGYGREPLPCRVIQGPNLWGQFKVAILMPDGEEVVRYVKHVGPA